MRNPLGVAIAVFAVLSGPLLSASPSLAATKSVKSAKAAKPAPVAEPPSSTVTQLAAWAKDSGDSTGLPFVIIDKLAARVFVYGKDGKLRGSAPALLGFARGDNSTPGVGDRELSDIAPEERTTPAGRFLAAYGPAVTGEKVFWVDYETAISLHPVVTKKPKERRLERLRSPTVADNRITFGCINVSKAFYEQVVRKTFTGTRGIVYILPETMTVAQVFPSFDLASMAGQLAEMGVPASKPQTSAIQASNRALPNKAGGSPGSRASNLQAP
jgi:hypothetical protein